MAEKMTDEQLLSLIANYERASLGSEVAAGATVSSTVYPNGKGMTTLEIDRYDALNAYQARPLGNEVENRSQVVIPEFRDTVDWIMPQVMRMFVATKNICRFDPTGPDDIQQAQLESDVVNHVLMKENNGFFVLHDFFKDAMMLRNGYAKVHSTKETTKTVDTYTEVTQAELASLLEEKEGEKVEVAGQHEYQLQPPIDPTMPPDPTQPPPQPLTVFDLKIRRTTTKRVVKVECIPPEEMRVSAKARQGLDRLPFVAHQTTMTRTELIQDGHDAAIVNTLPTGRPNWMEMDALARNSVTDQLSVDMGANSADFSMQDVETRHVAILVDYDGDGMAELRSVLVAGDEILDNEEIDEVPFASCSPMRMPHRHTGISFYDLLADLQVIKTTLFRQGLDNLYLANNGRVGVDWQNTNIDDLLTSRPGGVVRTKGNPQASLFPLQMPSNLTEQVLPALAYVDSLREMRTGVGKDTMGLDADALQDVTKGGQLAAMSAASLKIELVARFLAEGVKEICRKIHNEIIKSQDQEMMFEIAGKWVTVDPSSWRKRTKMTETVGLGSANREEARQNLGALNQMQQGLAAFGLVGPKQAYETFKMGVETLGYENASKFAMDPSSPEYLQHMAQMKAQEQSQPNPAVQVAQIKAQSDQSIASSQNQREVVKLQGQLAKTQADNQAAQARAQGEMVHAAIQSDYDRNNDTQSVNSQMDQTLIKVLGQILAQQLKQNAAVDAGAALKHDYSEVRGTT